MKNITFAIGVLTLSIGCSASAEQDGRVVHLLNDAQKADENAQVIEQEAKMASGMEAFKKESDAQYFRKLAEFKRTLASAVEQGDEEKTRQTRRALRAHEQSRVTPAPDPGNPFAPMNQERKPSLFSDENAAPTPEKKGSGEVNSKADWMNSLADQSEKIAKEKRSWAKDQPRKQRRMIEEFADKLEELAKVQRSIGTAMKNGDTEGLIKGQRELMKIRDDLKSYNIGMLPNLGLTN